MKVIIHWIDLLNEWIGNSIAWLTLAMVLTTFMVVVFRYLFNTGWIAMQESIIYMHAAVFLLAIAYTLKHDGHVRVDIFYRKFGKKTRAWIDLFGSLFLLLPMSAFILWISWDYVAASWAVKEGSREAGGLDGVFLLKATMLMMTFLLIIQAVSEILKNLLTILKTETAVISDG